MNYLILLAQTADASSIAQWGLPGVVIAWFALRAERKLEAIESVIGVLAKTVLLDVVSRNTAPDKVREQATELMESLQRRGR